MPPATQRTTRLRIGLAIAFAFVLPSVVLGGLCTTLAKDVAQGQPWIAAITIAPLAIGLGLFMGWPFVLGAVAVWGVLDQLDRHYVWTAAAVGLAAGLAVASTTFRSIEVMAPMIADPACAGVGLVTGLGVWWIAYGRQDRLPKPVVTRPQLSL